MIAITWTIVFSIALIFSGFNLFGALRELEAAQHLKSRTADIRLYLITGTSIVQSEAIRLVAFSLYVGLGIASIFDSTSILFLNIVGPILLAGAIALMSNSVLSYITRRKVSRAAPGIAGGK